LHHASLYTCYHEHITKGGHPLDQWVVYTSTLKKAYDWRGSPSWTQNVMEKIGKIDQIVSHALMLMSKCEMMKTWSILGLSLKNMVKRVLKWCKHFWNWTTYQPKSCSKGKRHTCAHYEMQQNVIICFQMLVKKEGVFIDTN
jgi:hypothetical protein